MGNIPRRCIGHASSGAISDVPGLTPIFKASAPICGIWMGSTSAGRTKGRGESNDG
jgi:hypothetical protein